MVALPSHTYIWEEAVPEEDVETGVNIRYTRVSTDVLLPGPTVEAQVKVIVKDDFKTLEITLELPKTFIQARRTAVRAAHGTGVDAGRLGGVINNALAMNRVSSHQKEVNRIYSKNEGKLVFEIDLPIDVDKHFCRRNDYGRDGAAQGLSIATYRHHIPVMQQADQLVYILHIEMIARDKPPVKMSSPQGFNLFHQHA